MNPTGHRSDDGRSLVFERRFAAPIDAVWASITDSDRLARWFGSWTGDPADGFVMVTMNAEAEAGTATRYDIEECEAPRRLRVAATDDFGTWLLSAELTEVAGGTELRFTQRDVDSSMLGDIAVGWEWYLDRLRDALSGSEPPSLADFESVYIAELGPHYAP